MWHLSKTLYASWHSSLGPEAASLEGTSSDGDASAPSNGSPTHAGYLSPGRMKAFSRLSRYGMTFDPLTESHGEALLTWYRAGFPVRIYPRLEPVTDLKASDPACGKKWRGSLAKYDPDTCLWRTAQFSLHGGLELFSATWPRWGTMQNGESSEQTMPELPTLEKGSGSWPTPTVTCRVCKPHQWAHRRKMEGGSRRSTYLADAVRYWEDRSGTPRTMPLDGDLNPMFQEWLMGWPLDWTELRPRGTDRYRKWSALHSEPYTNASNAA